MIRFSVPQLPYAHDALQPAISSEIMELHHGTHHAAYVSKLNAALEALEPSQVAPFFATAKEALGDEEVLLAALPLLDTLPSTVRTAVRNNGGGHYNHSLFWRFMAPGGTALPDELRRSLEEKYGTIDAFKDAFATAAVGLFGSGWVWLQPNLDIIALPNQDNPIMNGDAAPILGLDVWEHAYYLEYHAARKEYVDAWWSVVNWEAVEQQRKKSS